MSQHVIGPTEALYPSHSPAAWIVATCIALTYPKLSDEIDLVMVSVPPAARGRESVHAHL